MPRVLLYLLLINSVFCLTIAGVNSHRLPHATSAVLLNNLYSQRAVKGDRIEAKLTEAINLREQRVFIPVDSIISGYITEIVQADRGLQQGHLKVNFQTIHLPNGHIVYIDGYILSVKTHSQSRIKQKAKNVASKFNIFRHNKNNREDNAGKLTGEVSLKSKIFRAGKLGTGAVFGGPVGVAVATGSLIFDKGGQVSIDSGSPIQVQINTVNTYSVEGNIKEIIDDKYLWKPQATLNGNVL